MGGKTRRPESLSRSLTQMAEQLLISAGGSCSIMKTNCEMSSDSIFNKEQLMRSVAFRADKELNYLLERTLRQDDKKHVILHQKLHLLALDLDLSEELQILAQVERVITVILHLASVKPISDVLSILDREIAEGTEAIRHFFPDPNVLSTYSSTTGMTIIEVLVFSIYQLALKTLSFKRSCDLVSKVMGQHCVAEAEKGIIKDGAASSHNEQKLDESTFLKDLRDYNVEAAKAEGDRLRAQFLEEAQLKPPQVMRVIDCRASCKEKQVVLRDWEDCAEGGRVGYTAISHTYGQDVYTVFDCQCATICRAKTLRCSSQPCPHDPSAPEYSGIVTRQNQVISDILNMCAILREAGVDYAWHDGVCIAQYDKAEVTETIAHMGWIYSNASETVIFLHYVGEPIAPISHDNGKFCRWNSRVWTLQEAALSKCRRYCIRVGSTPIGTCKSLQEFQRKIALWYNDDSSKVEVIEEERFFEILKSLKFSLAQSMELQLHSVGNPLPNVLKKFHSWSLSLDLLITTLKTVCFSFPTIETALNECCRRLSKHWGDRINSILALAKVEGFVAPKDDKVEAATVKFFERQGQIGLAKALFSGQPEFGQVLSAKYPWKGYGQIELRKHTWLPSLENGFFNGYENGMEDAISFTVLKDGKLEVRGALMCIEARFMLKPYAPNADVRVDDAKEGIKAAGHIDNLTYLPLDVVYREGIEVGAYKVVLSESPNHQVGILIFPFLPAMKFPRAQAKGCFHAHLVIPWAKHRRFSCAIVVQGNPHADQVSKIGLFLFKYKPTRIRYSRLEKLIII